MSDLKADQQFRKEQHRVAFGMGAAAAATLALLLLLVLVQPIPLPDLSTSAARLAFVARADILVFAWLGVAIANVARLRFLLATDIAGGAQTTASPAVLRANALLQNTLEQVVFAAGSHYALAVQLPTGWMIVLPGLVGLFCVGRALFWLGYRHGAAARAFGFAMTFYPSVGACVVALALLFC